MIATCFYSLPINFLYDSNMFLFIAQQLFLRFQHVFIHCPAIFYMIPTCLYSLCINFLYDSITFSVIAQQLFSTVLASFIHCPAIFLYDSSKFEPLPRNFLLWFHLLLFITHQLFIWFQQVLVIAQWLELNFLSVSCLLRANMGAIVASTSVNVDSMRVNIASMWVKLPI